MTNALPAPPRRTGRPRWQPTDEQRRLVSAAIAVGNTIEVTAQFLNVSPKTLRHSCRAELEQARANLRFRMTLRLVQMALDGHFGALRYWLQCFGGPEWRVSSDQEAALDATMTTPAADADAVVRFYLPANHRDGPEGDDAAPTIEGGTAT